MSETPRTDAVEWRSGKNLADCQFVVFSEFARQLENELADKEKRLAEARAEIERLNKDLGSALDTVLAMLLVARGGECDIDTLHAEMNKVSKKPSEYIKHILKERDALIEQMREALRAWVRTPDIPLHEAIKVTEAALELAERAE